MIYTTTDTTANLKTFTCSDGTVFTQPLDIDSEARHAIKHEAMIHELEYVLAQLNEHAAVIYSVLKDWDHWTYPCAPKERLSEVLDAVSTDENTYLFMFKSKGDILKTHNAVKMFYDYLIVEHRLNNIYLFDEFTYGEPLPRSAYNRFEQIHYDRMRLREDDVLVMYATYSSAMNSKRSLNLGTAKLLSWIYSNEIAKLQGEKREFEMVASQTEDIGMDERRCYED